MKKYLYWIAAAVAIVGLLVWIFMPRAIEVETAVVAKGRFERTIEEDGKTRLRDRYVVSTPLAGRVSRITLREGDVIEKGAVIARVSPSTPAFLDERTEAEMRERVGAIEASSRRASVGVERARAALDHATIELKRSELLAEKGFVSPNQNETMRLSVRLREKELESAKQEEDAARHELQQTRVALQQYVRPMATSRARSLEITAPVSGRVIKVVQQSEDVLPTGTPIVEIGDPANFDVVVGILTADAAQVTPGMLVRMATTSSSGGDNGTAANTGEGSMLGHVRLIEPAAFTKVSALGVEEQRVNAIIDVAPSTHKAPSLGDGFRVNVRILVQAIEEGIKVPVSALYPMGDRSGVFVVEAGRATQRRLDISARNGFEALVKQGVSPEEIVILYPPSSMRVGARVVAKK